MVRAARSVCANGCFYISGIIMVELHRWLKWFRSGRISESLGWRTPDGNRRSLGYAV